LQSDTQQTELIERIQTQLGLKAAGHELHLGKTGIIPHLAAIGG
jgi:GTP 3',8-cyclase